MTGWPAPSLRHLARLTDRVGIVEHARFDRPRVELGYCTDDAGRLLAVASQAPLDPDASRLAVVALTFLARAHEGAGQFRLRLGCDGEWTDEAASDDATGRALFGLGTAAAIAPWSEVRTRALALFDETLRFRSGYPRAMAYAVLGAIAALRVAPGRRPIRELVADGADLLQGTQPNRGWPWPEPRLTYANALIADASLAVARTTNRPTAACDALELLDWLVRQETRETWFSFTPVGGRGPDGDKPSFDQQPIEAWAMTDACARALAVTNDQRWASAVRQAASWFLGHNDVGVEVFDPETGGGFDGLTPDGVNRNQGAESTLAFVATMRAARTLGISPTASPTCHRECRSGR